MPSKKSSTEQLEEDYQNLTPHWKGSQKPENLRSNLTANRDSGNLSKKSSGIQKFTFVLAVLQDFEDCSLHTATVYSYMLCKYMWFHQQNKQYFESQAEIARVLKMSEGAVKNALQWMLSKELIQVQKLRGAVHNKNSYKLIDKYNAYLYLKKSKKQVTDFQGEY